MFLFSSKKFGNLFLGIILFLSTACSDIITEQVDTTESFEIDLTNYSTNYFFLDTVYASVSPELNIYEYYHKLVPQINPYYKIKTLSVWKLSLGFLDEETQIRANAFLNLPALKSNENYDSSFYKIDQYEINGETLIYNRFEKLTQDYDYSYNPYTGVVDILSGVTCSDGFAAVYSIEGETSSDNDDLYFGKFSTEELPILKLFKPKNLNPNLRQAWKLQLRNIYKISLEPIPENNFEMDIHLLVNDEYYNSLEPFGLPDRLLNLFGFDNLDKYKRNMSDGVFDFINNITINQLKGEIIFPNLEPFGRDMSKKIPDSYRIFSLYDTTQSNVDTNKIKFKIEGKFERFTIE